MNKLLMEFTSSKGERLVQLCTVHLFSFLSLSFFKAM